jgi:esterase/lipase
VLRSFFTAVMATLFALAPAIAADAPAAAASGGVPLGIVIMHGKGGSPNGWVAPLANYLHDNGYTVENIEMPWSGRRDYDVGVQHADDEVTAAVARLRAQGAKKIFVAGHSEGGAYVLYWGRHHPSDGIIAISPGSGISGPPQQEIEKYLGRARELVAQGKGDEKTRMMDHEKTKGFYPIITTPKAYVEWFDPKGPMNMMRSIRGWSPDVPLLLISATGDGEPLAKRVDEIYAELPPNPHNHFFRASGSHYEAPFASAKEILRWTEEVAGVGAN